MSDDTFPLDWNEWRSQWDAWKAAHPLRRVSPSPFPGTNFLADEILGVFRVGDRVVELSEVTFPDLTGRERGDRRMVGITYQDRGGEREAGPLVRSFAELEQFLLV